jgi:hypothetical protein
MARIPRRVGPLGLALTAYDVWRQLVLRQARRYAPLIAGQALRSARAAAAARKKR